MRCDARLPVPLRSLIRYPPPPAWLALAGFPLSRDAEAARSRSSPGEQRAVSAFPALSAGAADKGVMAGWGGDLSDAAERSAEQANAAMTATPRPRHGGILNHAACATAAL
ncbi:hypothetical protein V497_02699, partial [Pseudogymnoascus sp. VKM F-4516 (FW-969)]